MPDSRIRSLERRRTSVVQRPPGGSSRRAGFTLIELLVVVGIMLLLTAMTIAAVNVTLEGDKVGSAARMVQSEFSGARSRASRDNQLRGVRFLTDPADPSTVSSMIFIGPPSNFTEGLISIGDPNIAANQISIAGVYDIVGVTEGVGGSFFVGTDITDQLDDAIPSNTPFSVVQSTANDGPYTLASTFYDSATNTTRITVAGSIASPATADGLLSLPPGVVPRWDALRQRGLLPNGSRLELTGNMYTVAVQKEDLNGNGTLDAGEDIDGDGFLDDDLYLLTKDYPGTVQQGDPEEYVLQLAPGILPSQEPRLLPNGVVIDLDNSQIPNSWGSRGAYNTSLDVMFSPLGRVIGPASADGFMHLLLTEVIDVEMGRLPGDLEKEGEEVLVTLNALSGGVSTHKLFLPTPWHPETTYGIGALVISTDPGERRFFQATNAGDSGTTEPGWDLVIGNTTVGGGGTPITWVTLQFDVLLYAETGEVRR